MTSRFPPFAFVELVSPYNKKNITRWLEDIYFMFSWQEQYLTRSLRSLVRYCSCHSNIKFKSSRHRVISSIYFGWEIQLRGNFWQGPFLRTLYLKMAPNPIISQIYFFVTSHFGTQKLSRKYAYFSRTTRCNFTKFGKNILRKKVTGVGKKILNVNWGNFRNYSEPSTRDN